MTIETLAKQGRTYTGLAGIDTARLKAIRNASLRACFNRLEDTRYRLEFVARIQGREYINDAAARSINSTWYSLESLDGGIIWIACGSEVPTDYSRLVPVALRKVRMLLVLGESEQMSQAFGGSIPSIVRCASMSEALRRAYYYDAPDDVRVLFSPSTAAGDETDVLGETFRREVNEL